MAEDESPRYPAELSALAHRNLEPALLGEPSELPINESRQQDARAAGLEPDRLSIALSGGGYRAALFHLGALRRLHEFGILPEIKTYSCVSGGSILAAHLARVHFVKSGLPLSTDEWKQYVEHPFINFVRKDIRTGPALVSWAWLFCLILGFVFTIATGFFAFKPWVRSAILAGLAVILLLGATRALWKMRGSGARMLAAAYRELNSGYLRNINDNVPDTEHLRFIFCATDLVFGVAWRMTAESIGDYQVGWADTPPDYKIASAVAASSCFPPVFFPAPVKFPVESFKRGRYRPKIERLKWAARICLTDGGVYDNLGIEPLWHGKSHKPNMLVSDGGGPLPVTSETRTLGLIQRYASIMQNQAISLRKRMLIGKFDDGKILGTYWGLSSAVERYRESALEKNFSSTLELPGYSADFVDKWISPIRTDLAYFSPAEVGILMNHGYSLANAAIQVHRPDLQRHSVSFQWPFTHLVNEQVIYQHLQFSSKLFNSARQAEAEAGGSRYFKQLDYYR